MTTETTKRWYIEDIETANRAAGKHFFDEDSKRFFRSCILEETYQGPGGVYFVTSEQFRPSTGKAAARRYTVRRFHPEDARVSSVPAFQAFQSAYAAKQAARRFAEGKE